jgi:hypothetical protein
LIQAIWDRGEIPEQMSWMIIDGRPHARRPWSDRRPNAWNYTQEPPHGGSSTVQLPALQDFRRHAHRLRGQNGT